MGVQNRVLVIMTNGDVYYVSDLDATHLMEKLRSPEPDIVRVTDVKSGARLTLNLRNVSALVEETSRG